MDELASAEFEAARSWARGAAERAEAQVGRPGVDARVCLQNAAANWWLYAARSLALRRGEDACAGFGHVARCTLAAIATRPPGTPPGTEELTALECSILSGTPTGPTDVPDDFSSYSAPLKTYSLALRAFVGGESNEARLQAEAARRVTPEDCARADWPEAVGLALHALTAGDAVALNTSLESVLAEHGAKVRKGSLKGLPAAIFNRPATVIGLLARRAGMTPAVPPAVRELTAVFNVRSLERWQGQPTRGLTCSVPLDILPLDLLS